MLYKGKNALSTSEVQDIRDSAGYKKLKGFKKLVVDFWMDDLNLKQQYKNQTTLWKAAAEAAADPPDELINLMPIQDLLAFADSLDDNPSQKLIQAIQKRIKGISKQDALDLQGVTIHTPNLPLNAPISNKTDVAPYTGREFGSFYRASNTLANAASNTTSAPNLHLLNQQFSLGNQATSEGLDSMFCPTCNRLQPVVYFEVDHQDAFSHIRDQFHKLARAISFDPALHQAVKKQLGTDFSTYFVTAPNAITGQEIFPTKEVMQRYSNDLDNLMEICRFCNGAFNKSDQPFVDWFKNNPLYGPAFIDSLKLNPKSLVARTSSGNGIGTSALVWFKTYHFPVLKQLLSLEQSIEAFRKSIHQQTQLFVNLSHESDPTKKSQLQSQEELLGRRNQASLGAVKKVSAYHQHADTYPLAPNSPAQYEQEVEEVGQNRQKRKRTETKPFKQSFESAYQEQPRPTGFATLEEQRAVDEGYRQGEIQRKADFNLGYSHGVQQLGQTHHSRFYHLGATKGQERLQEVQKAAFADAERGMKNLSVVQPGELESATLRIAYLEAFSDRLLQIQAEQRKLLQERENEIERLRQQSVSRAPSPSFHFQTPSRTPPSSFSMHTPPHQQQQPQQIVSMFTPLPQQQQYTQQTLSFSNSNTAPQQFFPPVNTLFTQQRTPPPVYQTMQISPRQSISQPVHQQPLFVPPVYPSTPLQQPTQHAPRYSQQSNFTPPVSYATQQNWYTPQQVFTTRPNTTPNQSGWPSQF